MHNSSSCVIVFNIFSSSRYNVSSTLPEECWRVVSVPLLGEMHVVGHHSVLVLQVEAEILGICLSVEDVGRGQGVQVPNQILLESHLPVTIVFSDDQFLLQG